MKTLRFFLVFSAYVLVSCAKTTPTRKTTPAAKSTWLTQVPSMRSHKKSKGHYYMDDLHSCMSNSSTVRFGKREDSVYIEAWHTKKDARHGVAGNCSITIALYSNTSTKFKFSDHHHHKNFIHNCDVTLNIYGGETPDHYGKLLHSYTCHSKLTDDYTHVDYPLITVELVNDNGTSDFDFLLRVKNKDKDTDRDHTLTDIVVVSVAVCFASILIAVLVIFVAIRRRTNQRRQRLKNPPLIASKKSDKYSAPMAKYPETGYGSAPKSNDDPPPKYPGGHTNYWQSPGLSVNQPPPYQK